MKKRVGAELADALDTKKHPKAESYTLVKDIKKKLAAELPKTGTKKTTKLQEEAQHTTRLCASASSASR